MGGLESRRAPRRVYQRPIGVLHRGEYRVVRAQQLSEGGLLFNSQDLFKVGDKVVATLVMPGGNNVIARGEIIYTHPSDAGRKNYGVKFIDLQFHVRRLIRNYVAAKTEAEAESEVN